MQVRVFESSDMASGLKKIKEELGPDALILSTRTIRNGKLGILGKPMLEITAAIDADLPPQPKELYTPKELPSQKGVYANPASKQNSGFRHTVDDSIEHYLNDQGSSHSNSNSVADSISVSKPDSRPDFGSDFGSASAEFNRKESVNNQTSDHDLHSEVNELKDLVKNLAGQISQLSEKETTHKQNEQNKQTALQVKDVESANRFSNNPIVGDYILSMLIGRGINIETSRTIAGFLRESLTEQELSDPANVAETIISTIQDLIEVSPPVFAQGQAQQRIALVGPTGVGKTTTLAKIAAAYLSKHSNSIALITIDTYRIAAVEQLKVYGEIMQLPVDVVISPEQLEQAIAKHSDKDLILIDTAGRSPRDTYCIDELASFLGPDLHIDKHLVLSAGTRENELLDTIARFNTLDISNTIFTKIDECSSLGILLNIQIQNSNPLSYVTNGQRVPEDLLEISPKIVAELIMSQDEGTMHD
ncbi:MAG: flagellar biosynthesis protein FlhF [Desulfobulbaceae bacterium]|nr:flagellar biosynthesis protein FlhF [Desulfobulbaceae bacterium]